MQIVDSETLTKTFNLSPLETTLILGFVAVFVWLYHEIKNQLVKQADEKAILLEKTLIGLSKILSLGYELQSNKDNNDEEIYKNQLRSYYSEVLNSLPFLDQTLSKEFIIIVGSNEINDKEKISKINLLVEENIKILSEYNKGLYATLSPLDTLFNFGRIMRNTIIAGFLSFIIIYLITFLFLLGYFGSDHGQYFIYVRPLAFLTIIMYLLIAGDLILLKQLNLRALLIIPIIASLLWTIFSSNLWWSLASILIFILLNVLLYGMMLNQKANESTSQSDIST